MIAAEPLIRERLEAMVSSLAGVYAASDLSVEAITGKRLPAAFVAADGYRVLETSGQTTAVRIASRWLVLVVARNVALVREGAAARAAASDPARECLASLCGWSPGAGYQGLHPVTGPRPIYKDGILIYPLAFECAELIQQA